MTTVSILLDKDEAREFGKHLWLLRHQRHMYLKNVAAVTKIPAYAIEGMELGRIMRYKYLQQLLKFYGKKVKISLE